MLLCLVIRSWSIQNESVTASTKAIQIQFWSGSNDDSLFQGLELSCDGEQQLVEWEGDDENETVIPLKRHDFIQTDSYP